MASGVSVFPLLRRAAPRLSRHFFACRKCSQKPLTAKVKIPYLSRVGLRSNSQTIFPKAVRSYSAATTASRSPSPLSRVSQRIRETFASFPETSDRAVAYWLFGSAASVFGIVILGGLTRLTESGLSITEWRPVTGTLPPRYAEDWSAEFAKYRASPEFQQLNPNMDLSQFKRIFWMEYTHRLWGRVIGLATLVPTIYFIARRRVSLPMARNLLVINCLIGLQGGVGWWMVKSGLKDDLFAQGAHPRVSQYRLATHLGLAFTVYTSMLWNGLQSLREGVLVSKSQPNRAESLLKRLASPHLSNLRYGTAGLLILIATTALGGALVAGLDAGLIYNELPYMGLGLTPPKTELFSDFYSRKSGDRWWRNVFENPSLVQLNHRILATTTFCAAHAVWIYARFNPKVRAGLTRGALRTLNVMLGLVWLQVTLGITTLLYLVPVPVAAAHQAGSLALLTSVVVLGSRVWTPPRLGRLVARRVAHLKTMQSRRGVNWQKSGETS